MTPEDRKLDPRLLEGNHPLTLYRLARAKYANLSGLGSAIAPGRWNDAGEEAIYTSLEIGVPVLERLVHTPKNLIPSNLALMRIQVAPYGKWFRGNDFEEVKKLATGAGRWFCSSIKSAKRYFALRDVVPGPKPFAIAVPSVIVPVWNVILFPQQAGFWDQVTLESAEPFSFDPRLFPDEAQESPDS